MAEDRVTCVSAKLPTCSAEAWWNGDEPLSPDCDITLRIDPHKSGQIKCAVHELLHALLWHTVHGNFNDDLEEVQIQALEELIFDEIIEKSPRRMAEWRKMIDAKLGEVDD